MTLHHLPAATRQILQRQAERLVERYIRGLYSVEELMERIYSAWQESVPGGLPQEPALDALARGVCSQILCEACQVSEGWRREIAFERLRDYLLNALNERSSSLPQETREEVVQQTLVEILQSFQRSQRSLKQPQAFLAWARVILFRQLAAYWRWQAQQPWVSLEEQEDPLLGEVIDERAPNPLQEVLGSEQRTTLYTALERLHNPRYRLVLSKLYLHEMEASEVATSLHVSVADIYLWRHRGIAALQKQLRAHDLQ